MSTVRVTRGPGSLKFSEFVAGLSGKQGKVGWLTGATHQDGTPLAQVAATQEFGAGRIPPRPFMRPTAEAKKAAWGALAGRLAKHIIEQGGDPASVLELVAAQAAGDVAETITRLTTPPLAASTIQARKNRSASGQASVKPLVDTGLLLASLTWGVE